MMAINLDEGLYMFAHRCVWALIRRCIVAVRMHLEKPCSINRDCLPAGLAPSLCTIWLIPSSFGRK